MAIIKSVTGKNTCVLLNDKCQVEVRYKNKSWKPVPEFVPGLLLNIKGKDIHTPFYPARYKKLQKYNTGYGDGLKILLKEFYVNSKKVNIEVELIVLLEKPEEEMIFKFIVISDKDRLIKECHWPGPFLLENNSSYSVIPQMQGMLLPNAWDKEVKLYYNGKCCTRGLYMPWWGQVKDSKGYIAIFETPWDAGCNLKHPAGGPTCTYPVWYASLGEMEYERSIRYIFLDDCNYVNLAKKYRIYVKSRGGLRTLREKYCERKIVGRLIGAPVVHTSILYHVVSESSHYDKKQPHNNHQLRTFNERISDLNMLREKIKTENIYLHLDGWGKRGYDNLHPDVFPPCKEAGGWAGMRKMSDICEKLNIIFAIHDQYRDYYLDAETYNEQLAVRGINDNIRKHCEWAGGWQSLLCAKYSLGYLRRNMDEILDNSVKLKGVYLDVFSAAPLDECFHPGHKMSKKECIDYRVECFNYIRSKGMVISSEEPIDFAVPYLDLVHWGPYIDPGTIGPANGIPVPLFNLVYHDCIILPWKLGKRICGMPQNDSSFLHGLLNGGMGYLSINPDRDEIKKVETICRLHKKVGYEEMVAHEFLSEDYRRQKTTFSDGTTIEVDFKKERYLLC